MLSLPLSHGTSIVRLTVCLLATFIIHLLFFWITSARKDLLPSLRVSLTPSPLSIQFRSIPAPSKQRVSPAPKNLQTKKEVATDRQSPLKEPRKKTREEAKESSSLNEEYVSHSMSPREVSEAEYLSNPPPTYPEQARRRRQQGAVLLLVDIDSVGEVEKVTVKESAGFPILDRSALATVAKWRFAPAISEGSPVPSQVLVPIRFELGKR
jgi:protein TonB